MFNNNKNKEVKRLTGLLVLLFIFNISCKNRSKQIATPIIKEEINSPKELMVNFRFRFKTNKTDTFKIMLSNIEVDELQKKNIYIFEDVIPSSGEDSIIAKFDPGNISNSITINLGNKEIKEVEIIEILVSYGSNGINISTNKDIDKYLAFNRFIERDSTSNIIRTKKVDGLHNPGFSLKRKLINQLRKE